MPAISVRSSAVSTGPRAGALIRVNRNDAPQIAASSSRRAASVRRMLALLFQREELALALQSPGVAAHAAVGPHRTVAGHGKRHRVGAAGAADRTHRRGRADGAGDLRIRTGLASRDAPQLVPDAALAHRAANVERQPCEARFAFDEGEDPGFQVLQLARHDFGRPKLLSEEAFEALVVIAQLDRAKALVGRPGRPLRLWPLAPPHAGGGLWGAPQQAGGGGGEREVRGMASPPPPSFFLLLRR